MRRNASSQPILGALYRFPRSTSLVLSVLSMLILSLLLPLTMQADLTLANKGKSKYRIVVATNAPPAELQAATELQHYLEAMSGVELPIVSDTERTKPHEIAVGDNRRVGESDVFLDRRALGSDGFIIRTVDRRLLIVGGTPRGTLNGVYTFIEEQLGVRWFTPEIEYVPTPDRLEIPKLDRTVVPPLEYREVYWTEMIRDADFAARHRLNGNAYAFKAKHGGRAVVYQPFVHSFDALVPPDLFGEHPEFFPWIDGERRGGYVQRCLTNPEVLRLATAQVRQWLRDNPEITVVSVSQNDTFKYCECETCAAIDAEEGSHAGSLLQFVNGIADAIRDEFPDVYLDTLAYQYTRKAPRTIRPRSNVIIRLCSIECCFAHSLETCTAPENESFRKDLAEWQRVTSLIYVWDYTTNFAHYQQPFPNFDVLQSNVQFFLRHSVKGLFEQGNYSAGGLGSMAPLRAYLLAKLLWDPRANLARHTEEFLHAYYGPAAPQIAEYLEIIQAPARNPDGHAHIFDRSTASYLTDAMLEQATAVLAEAETRAATGDHRFHVQLAQLPIQYVKLSTRRVEGEERREMLKAFLSTARQAGISNISEQKPLDTWAAEMSAP